MPTRKNISYFDLLALSHCLVSDTKHNVNHPKEKRASTTRCRNQGFGGIDHSGLDTKIKAEVFVNFSTSIAEYYINLSNMETLPTRPHLT